MIRVSMAKTSFSCWKDEFASLERGAHCENGLSKACGPEENSYNHCAETFLFFAQQTDPKMRRGLAPIQGELKQNDAYRKSVDAGSCQPVVAPRHHRVQ
jgi:hypothetical protein